MTLVPNLNGPGSSIFDELVAIYGDPREPPASQAPAVRPVAAPGMYPVPAGAYADQAALALAPEVIAGLFANAPRDGSPWVAVVLFGGGAAQQVHQYQYGFSGPYPSAPGYGYHVAPHYPAAYQAGAGTYQASAVPPREAGLLEQARYAPIPALPPAPPPPPAATSYGAGERTRQIGGSGYSGGFSELTGLGEQPWQAQAPYRAEQYSRYPEPVWPQEDAQEAVQDAGSGRSGWLSRRFGAARRESRDG